MARWRENRKADQGWRGASREVRLPAATTAACSGDPDRRCREATEARMASTREQGIGSVPVQEAPGGNPGTPGTKTSPPSMSCNATRFHAANPNRMAPGNACHPESPGFRRGLFGCLSRACSKKPRVETRGLRARKPPRRPCHATPRASTLRTQIAWHPGTHATRSPPDSAGGFLGAYRARAPRSPGWKPGDSGHENLPAVHAAWHYGRRPPLQEASVAVARPLIRASSVRPTTCSRRRSRAREA